MQRKKGTPKVYLIGEGKLQYPIYNMETRKYEKKILVRGVDVDDVTFDFLLESYHNEELKNRYFQESLDCLSEKKKAKYESGEEGIVQDPIDGIADKNADIFKMIFDKDPEEPEEVKIFIERVWPKLTESQKELFYAIYGECKEQEEFRLQEIAVTGKVVTHQAISNRVKKVHKRVEKLMPEFFPIKE